MKMIHPKALARMNFELKWQSGAATHTERYAFRQINFWRDLLPGDSHVTLMEKSKGDSVSMTWPETKPPYDFIAARHVDLSRRQFGAHAADSESPVPRVGRFYPQGLLSGLAGVFPQNVQPFRVTDIQNGHLKADLNHPLAGRPMSLTASVEDVQDKMDERGGSCTDVLSVLSDGPGMQARWSDHPTDFFSDDPFRREDETDDANFYEKPRIVHHLDDTARELVRAIYGKHTDNGMTLLDLMSSWTSHLPEDRRFARVAGLGLNLEELALNPVLTDYTVHDLNRVPLLPYPSDTFDAVICTVSVEYLTRPFDVFSELARVLRSGGKAVFTFSNRWFPPKAIRVWRSLHDFERMGLVLEYFMRSGRFADLETFSMRGLPRPETDRYYPTLVSSDPVYAVWGVKH